MAVLLEAISVVIRCNRLLAAFSNDWEAFTRIVPNRTLCADDELVRVGFMVPDDAKVFVNTLEQRGLSYLVDGIARDLVVVDQQRGPLARCDWLEFSHVDLAGDPKKRIAACRLSDSSQSMIFMPEGWVFEGSLSSSFGFMPNEHVEKSLIFSRHDDGLDVYRNRLTGKEVFVGRSAANRKGEAQ
jgi:hypothetical protein